MTKFRTLGEKGDKEVARARELAAKLAAMRDDEDFARLVKDWEGKYQALTSARSGVLGGTLTGAEWVPTASANINQEFAVRSVAFAPTDARERVLYYNGVLRPSVATLCEFTGRKRAKLGGVISSGTPIPPDTLETLGGYRAIVDQAVSQALLLKELSSTSEQLSSAIADFEKEFLGEYQKLREEVYAASEASKPYPVDGATWIDRATKAINTGLAISNVAGDLGTKATEETASQASTAVWMSGGLSTLAIVVFVCVFFFVKRSVTGPLTRVIVGLTGASDQAASASGQISESSQQLASGASEQAAALEETSSSMEELASQTKGNAASAQEAVGAITEVAEMAKHNADTAKRASELSVEARQAADNGANAVQEITAAMTEIRQGSDKISDII